MCRSIAASLTYLLRTSFDSAFSRRDSAVSERANSDDISISSLGTLPREGSRDKSGDNEKGSGPRPMLEDIRFNSNLLLERSERDFSPERKTALVLKPV
jgi:hypothetical protein